MKSKPTSISATYSSAKTSSPISKLASTPTTFALLILSPASVDSRWVREEYTDTLWEEIISQKPKLLHFNLLTNHPEGFRAIRTFLLDKSNRPPQRFNHLPVRPPIFIGREDELAELHTRLAQPASVVHVSGMPGRSKTRLALQFAHLYQTDFEAVYWLPCVSGDLTAISTDLARLLVIKLDRDTPDNVRELNIRLAAKRCLLIHWQTTRIWQQNAKNMPVLPCVPHFIL